MALPAAVGTIGRSGALAGPHTPPPGGVGEPSAELMMIGVAARRSGFTVRALRFYERAGLLPPSRRSPSRYRLYSEADLHQLEFIRRAKALGLSLHSIRELVTAARTPRPGMTRGHLIRMLDERIAQAAQQITILNHLMAELRRRRQALAKRHGRAQGYCTCLHEAAAGSPVRRIPDPARRGRGR